MNTIYLEERDESLIWLKRKTQDPQSSRDPSLISLWPHFLIAVNAAIQDLPDSAKKGLKKPFNGTEIRKFIEEMKDQWRPHLGIHDNFDLKNVWPRFTKENLLYDFNITPEYFSEITTSEDWILFKDFSLNNIGDNKNPKALVIQVTGLNQATIDSIWDQSTNFVALYVFGLVCRSFYGHVYRNRIFDKHESFTDFIRNNETLLTSLSPTSDTSTRGPNDAIAIIHAFFSHIRKTDKNLNSDKFNQLVVHKSSLMKDISQIFEHFFVTPKKSLKDALTYFDLDVEFGTSVSSINSADNQKESKVHDPLLVILQGPPGTGKTRLARLRSKHLNIQSPRICQFHPSYSYEQFVEGIHPVAFVDGTYKYQPVDGPLLISWRKVTANRGSSLCIQSASLINFPAGILPRYFGIGEKIQIFSTRDSDKPIADLIYAGFDTFSLDSAPKSTELETKQLVTIYFKGIDWGNRQNELLILDELNRASVPQVFGELLYALSLVDGEMSESERKSSPVRLQYSQEEFYWPDGLHIIATLNQADRSTEDLDQALQRRFEIQNVAPESQVLSSIVLDSVKTLIPASGTADDIVSWIFSRTKLECSKLSIIMDAINDTLKDNSSIFDADKKLLGQGIFLKTARVTAKAALQETDPNFAKERFISELKTSLISQLQAICNNNTTLIADILHDAISNFNLMIPREIVQEILNVINDDHPLNGRYAVPHKQVA